MPSTAARPRKRRPALSALHGDRRQALVERLLADVFQGEFPAGQRMKVEHLAARYQVSATPVREALVALAGIGIVDLAANRGAVLRAFGPRQLREICHVRRVLESEAARCACGRIAPFELESLAGEFRRLGTAERSRTWSADTLRFDTQLHELIAERCGNQRLAHEIGRYRALHRTLREVRHARRQAQADYGSMDENAEHLEIVEALLAGDAAAAAAAMSRHIDRAADLLEHDLFDAERIKQERSEPFLATSGPVPPATAVRRKPQKNGSV